ncbi:hypothetical protein KC851_01430 [Candidatus Kaiserbacteria bacterium]|nr:hypothetical protein [Candidatus Kaiserbacteria bacterium]
MEVGWYKISDHNLMQVVLTADSIVAPDVITVAGADLQETYPPAVGNDNRVYTAESDATLSYIGLTGLSATVALALPSPGGDGLATDIVAGIDF